MKGDGGENVCERKFAKGDGGENVRERMFARGDLQGHRTCGNGRVVDQHGKQ